MFLFRDLGATVESDVWPFLNSDISVSVTQNYCPVAVFVQNLIEDLLVAFEHLEILLPNSLIENTGKGLLEGRTVGTLLDAYDTLQACINTLSSESG